MVTLNELLDISEVGSYTIYLLTDREYTGPRARLEVPGNSADMGTVRRMFGDWQVKKLSAAFKGDPRMIVEIMQPEDQETSSAPLGHLPQRGRLIETGIT